MTVSKPKIDEVKPLSFGEKIKEGWSKTSATLNTPVGELFSGTSADPSDDGPSWSERLKAGLAKTNATLNTPVGELFSRSKINASLYEELEATLLMADCGIAATSWLLDELKASVKRDGIENPAALRAVLIDLLTKLLAPIERPLEIGPQRPFIIMLAGINGAGKTTSIGKLARHFQQQGLSVLLAAGDTFRAAAKEQLMVWGERNGITVIAQESGDPAAVIFDADRKSVV